MVNSQWPKEETRGNGFPGKKTQPKAANPPPLRKRNGPPALEKGGYTLWLALTVGIMVAPVCGLEKGGYTLGWRPLFFQYKGMSPRTYYPPFSRAGDQPSGWWWVSSASCVSLQKILPANSHSAGDQSPKEAGSAGP
ncbi:hypothetical protein [Acidaminococcus sp.]|uniref:hypothetical protein n=1 Tax=Acidaminococcus sp. TaxID=1872103 RepID=UPI00352139DF